jgi:phospholipid/cholesterol/gamma-HCH transport system substrate-binding protein
MSSAVKVGIFATLGLVLLAWLIWKIEDINPFQEEGRRVDATFDSVAGLDDKSAVRVAGVRVGRVDGIRLQGKQARVTLLLEQPVELTQGSTARIANMGLLGDKYVELVPGPAGAPPLPDDAVLPGVTPPGFDEAMAKLDAIGTSIQEVTGSLSQGLSGDRLNALFASIQATSDQIRVLVEENRVAIHGTMQNAESASATLARELPRLADEMARAVTEIADLVSENRPDVAATTGNVRELTTKLQTSVDNLNTITSKIASGEGTIGKLVHDPQAHDALVTTLDSIQSGVGTLTQTLGAANKFKFQVDLNSFYLEDRDDTRTALDLVIDPSSGRRLYRAGLARTPDGNQREKTQYFTVTDPQGVSSTTTLRTFEQNDGYVLSGMFGYQTRWDGRLWAGIIENRGGLQMEVPFLRQALWVSGEAFDFGRRGPLDEDLDPHLRLSGRWQFTPNLYVIGGLDDPLEQDSFFLGAGARWTDENLKWLLQAAPGL